MTNKLLSQQANNVLTLTFNRPEIRNAVDPETMQALQDSLNKVAEDNSVRVVVITGTGGHFCSGADIQGAMAMEGNTADNAYHVLTEIYAPTLLAIRNCPKPVIAAVDGYAAGLGCDIALRCDLRVVSSEALFTELFIRVGLIPDGGGTFLLPRLVGLGKAFEMMFTGEKVPAEEAYRLGLANKVYPQAEFADSVRVFAEALAKQAPLALERGKKAMLAALEGNATYAEALQREATYQREIFGSEDGVEGFMAFMQKREPQWKGR